MSVLETGGISATDAHSTVAAGAGRRPGKSGERKRWRVLQNRIERARSLRRSGNHLGPTVSAAPKEPGRKSSGP